MQELKKMKESHYTIGDYLKFIIPSLLGIFLLMIPISVNGEITLVVAVWVDFIEKYIGTALPALAVILIAASFIFALAATVFRPAFILNSNMLRALFYVGPIALATRGLATIFGFMALFQIGPEWIWSEDTGGFILSGLLTTLVTIFFFAGYIL